MIAGASNSTDGQISVNIHDVCLYSMYLYQSRDFLLLWRCLLKIDDIEEEHDDEITTQQSKMLDDILSFLEQCEKHDRK